MIQLDAGLINDHNTLQGQHGTECLLQWKETRKIADLEGETVMEIGCGPGNNSTKNILRFFPGVQKIIATDVSEDMIRLAKLNSGHPKVEYFVANAEDESFFQQWSGTVDKVFSFFVLQWLENQEKGFRNIFNVLRPGGEAALLMPLRADSFDAAEKIKQDVKWKEIFKDVNNFMPLSQAKGLDASYFHKMFANIGFEVLSCEGQDNVFDHQTSEKFKKFLCSICDLTKHVPESKKEEFGEELLYRCKKMSCDDGQGSQNLFRFSLLTVFLRKPTTKSQ